MGCTLIFAAVLAKMWRIYYIFHDSSITKKVGQISNRLQFSVYNIIQTCTSIRLMTMCISIAVGMAILLLIGLAVPSIRPSANKVEDAEHPPILDVSTRFRIDHFMFTLIFQEHGTLQVFYVYRCSYSTVSIIWEVILYAYYGVLQVIALFLAVQTRKVNKIIHNSKEVVAIIYITSTLMVVIVISFVLRSYHNIHGAIFTSSLVTVGLIVLGFTFIPKVGSNQGCNKVVTRLKQHCHSYVIILAMD